MIVIVHDNNKVITIYSGSEEQLIKYNPKKTIGNILFEIAKSYPDKLIVWVHKNYKAFLNTDQIEVVFHHKLIMASYSIDGEYEISKHIGYIEQKPYTNISRGVSYPTWLMSSDVGGVNAEVLNKITQKSIANNNSFEFILSSIAKQAMTKGLFCYSEPQLIKKTKLDVLTTKKVSRIQLFKFVRQQYKFAWSLNLLLCFIIFEKKFPLLAFFNSLFFKSIRSNIDFNKIDVKSKRKEHIIKTLDVIIPTLGRKDCLYDVLKDFSKQTQLPKNIIIVEQNPEASSSTELDYLTNEVWPFKIKHHFTHKTGACNARNIAMGLVESEWVFLADDDIRFENDLIENAFDVLNKYGNNALNLLCLQSHEKQAYFFTSQTDIFGSGTSIIKSSLLKKVKFDMSFEFGFGEDSDFGMQIRNQGTDVIFIPHIKITHLKAPIGGFRTKVKQLWDNELIQPKPSPTIMLFIIKHYNKFQIRGYKYILFIKFYRKQSIINPLKYIKYMNTRWDSSEMWAKNLVKNEIK